MTEILLNPLLVTIASAALAVLFAHAALVKLGDLALLEHIPCLHPCAVGQAKP